jgi:DNA invertase Pin-like site-specific DNA recombinase
VNAGTRVLGYCRVSTHEQAHNGVGLAAQEAAIRAECASRGWLLVDLIRDEGASGKSLERRGLRAALARIARGEADGLIVSKLDRLSRSVVDFGTLLEWFTEVDANLIALDLGIDTSTPGGRLVANVFASVAEWEREIIGQRTREGLAAVRAGGKAISRPAIADQPKLERRIRRLREKGWTLQRIADKLNAEKVPTLRGGELWRPSSVQVAAGYKRRKPRRAVVDLPRANRRSNAKS